MIRPAVTLTLCAAVALGLGIAVTQPGGVWVALMVVGAILLFFFPHVFMMTFIVAAPLYVYRIWVPGLSANLSIYRATLAVSILAYAVDLVKSQQSATSETGGTSRSTHTALILLLLGVAFVYLMGAMRTENPDVAWRGFAQKLLGMFSILFVVMSGKRVGSKKVMEAFHASSLMPLGVGVYQLFAWATTGIVPALPFQAFIDARTAPFTQEGIRSGIITGFSTGAIFPRITSTLSDPNFFGIFLVVLVLMGLPMVRASGKWRATVALAAVLLVFTFSRSAFAAMLIGMACLATLHPAFRRRASGPLWALIVPVILVAAWNFVPEVNQVLMAYSSRFTSSLATGLDPERSARALGGIRAFLSAPILGVGTGNFELLYGYRTDTSTTHNFLLTIAAELGSLGLAGVLAFLGTTAVRMVNTYRELARRREWGATFDANVSLVACFAALMLFNLTYDHLFNGVDVNWVWLGLVWHYISSLEPSVESRSAALNPNRLQRGVIS